MADVSREAHKLSEHREPCLTTVLQLMAELDRLLDEQPHQNLRDPEVMDDYNRRIDALRQKLRWLKAQRGPANHGPRCGE